MKPTIPQTNKEAHKGRTDERKEWRCEEQRNRETEKGKKVRTEERRKEVGNDRM